jgi:hypothetical protein
MQQAGPYMEDDEIDLMEYITKLRKKNSNSDIPMPLT